MVESFKAENFEDKIMLDILDEEIKILQREVKDNKIEVNKNLREVEKLKKDQSAKEIYAMDAMVEKIAKEKDELTELIARLSNLLAITNITVHVIIKSKNIIYYLLLLFIVFLLHYSYYMSIYFIFVTFELCVFHLVSTNMLCFSFSISKYAALLYILISLIFRNIAQVSDKF